MASANDEEIYGNNDAILLHQLGRTGMLLGDLQNPGGYDGDRDSHDEEAECDGALDGYDDTYDDDYDSFTSDEEEIEDTNQQEIAPPKEKNTLQVQNVNMQGRPCDDEDANLMVRTPSPRENIQQTPDWYPNPQAPSNISRQLLQGCGVPWKPHPTSKEMNSAVKGVFFHPPNNVRSSGPPSVNHINRAPMPIPGQKKDCQNKVLPEPPESPAITPSDLSKLSLKRYSETEGNTVKPSRLGNQRSSLRAPRTNWGAKNGPPLMSDHQASNQQDTLAQHRKFQNSVRAASTVPVKSSPTRCGPIPQNSNKYSGPPTTSAASPTAFAKLENGERVILNPLYKSISDKPYFHLITREYAQTLITKGRSGAFLIRPSRLSNNPLTLTVNSEGEIFHVSIRRRKDNLFALGKERRGELGFSTIDDIVATHRETPIVLNSGTSFTLNYSPPRIGNTYVHHSVPSKGNRY